MVVGWPDRREREKGDRGVIGTLRSLWAGRLPLKDAFWTYAVFWGLLINVAAGVAALALIVAGKAAAPAMAPGAVAGASMLPLLALALHLAPVPYNIIALVGVWRSAGRPDSPPSAALAARSATLALFAVLLLV
jgi:hypothetical protein